jgi:hypothetical protein
MGLLIEGHDPQGSDDAGLAAAVRARLFELGAQGPHGIEVTQRTDVSSLPSQALGLIPEGRLEKLAQVIVSIFTPATPWRVDVTEQDDDTIVVSIRRNGLVAEAIVIRAKTLGLQGGVTPTSKSTVPADAFAAGWKSELRTAASVFILVALARRYYHLHAGLSGATEWRSVALQVIAADRAPRLDDDTPTRLLATAVAADAGNVAAELALLYEQNRPPLSVDDRRTYAAKLRCMLASISNADGMTPLRQRIRFNLMNTQVNLAMTLLPALPSDHRPTSTAKGFPTVDEGRNAFVEAFAIANKLSVFWRESDNTKEFPELSRDMVDAIRYSLDAAEAEWSRRFSDRPAARSPASSDARARPLKQATMLARYQRACASTARAALEDQAEERRACYDHALDDLEMVCAIPRYRVQARSDPSLRDLQDLTAIQCGSRGLQPIASTGILAPTDDDAYRIAERFKKLTGDPVADKFLKLPPLEQWADGLAERGIYTDSQLIGAGRYLFSELGIAPLVAARLVRIAALHQYMTELSTRPNSGVRSATPITFLCLELNIDGLSALSERVISVDAGRFRDELLEASKRWNVVTPTQAEIETWVRHKSYRLSVFSRSKPD